MIIIIINQVLALRIFHTCQGKISFTLILALKKSTCPQKIIRLLPLFMLFMLV